MQIGIHKNFFDVLETALHRLDDFRKINIFGSRSEIQMHKEKNISKLIVLRFAFLLVILTGAVVFDLYHDDSTNYIEQTAESKANTNFDVAQAFYFSQSSSFKLANRTDKLLSCILHAANQDKFLSRFHNYRTFHSLKEESVKDRKPFHLMAHFMKFSSVQYSSPDDDSHFLS